jgi:hypothetical protein
MALLDMTFADFETRIRDDLDRMLAAGGFSSARDIAAITVNRWSHGYGYVANSLFDPDITTRCSNARVRPPGASPSPIRIQRATPMRTWRSMRRQGRWGSWRGEPRAKLRPTARTDKSTRVS